MADTPEAAGLDYKLHGQTVVLHPLSFRDWGRIENWMRQEIVDRAKEALKDRELNEPAARILMSEAYKQATRITIHDPGVIEGMLRSLEGTLRVIHISLSRDDPKLTLDGVEKLLGNDLEAATDLYDKITELSFPAQIEAAKKNLPSPQPAMASQG